MGRDARRLLPAVGHHPLPLARPTPPRVALAAAQNGGGQGGAGEENAGQYVYKHGGVELREAEEHFVDEEENLEEGEKLLRAIKAFDDRGVMLCAGALVRTSLGENYQADAWDTAFQTLVAQQDRSAGSAGGGERGAQAQEEQIYHDLWLGDSVEEGVGPNLQIKGALAVLDTLFLHHLRLARSGERFRVHADGDLASACRTAAQMRGFAYEVQEETGEDVLVFDTWHRGPEAYTRAAVADARAGDAASLAMAILHELTRTLTPLALPPRALVAARQAAEEGSLMEEGEEGYAAGRAPGRRWVEGWDGEEVIAGGRGWEQG